MAAVAILLLYARTLGELALMARSLPSAGLSDVRSPSPVLHATLAVLLLLFATVLALSTPSATTRYGRRRQRVLTGSAGRRAG